MLKIKIVFGASEPELKTMLDQARWYDQMWDGAVVPLMEESFLYIRGEE